MLKLKKIPVKKSVYPVEISDSVPFYNPSFQLSDKQVSEVADWEVGENYQMVIEVKMVGKQEYKNGKSTGASGSFEIISYKNIGESMSDDDMEELQGIALSKD